MAEAANLLADVQLASLALLVALCCLRAELGRQATARASGAAAAAGLTLQLLSSAAGIVLCAAAAAGWLCCALAIGVTDQNGRFVALVEWATSAAWLLGAGWLAVLLPTLREAYLFAGRWEQQWVGRQQ